MKQLCKKMAGAAAILFILAACSENNSNYPEEYVGFEKATKNYSFDKNKDTEEFDVKIIAAWVQAAALWGWLMTENQSI